MKKGLQACRKCGRAMYSLQEKERGVCVGCVVTPPVTPLVKPVTPLTKEQRYRLAHAEKTRADTLARMRRYRAKRKA